MSQVSPGDDGSTRRPGPEARKATPAKRPPAKAAPKGRPPTGGAKGRPPTGGAKGRPPASGGAKGRAPRPNMKITAAPPRRFAPSTLAYVTIAVVVVIVVVFVVVKVSGGSNKASTTQLIPNPVAAPASLVAQVTGVTPAVSNAVGLGSGVSPPQVLAGQPTLTSGGKPEMLYIGAEFCPFCAAERWAMVIALSRFGTWSGLDTTTSSLWDSDPGTATFTFRNATFTSNYVDLVSIEHETNDNFGSGTRKLFQPLTTAQGNLWQKYSTHFGENTGYPFIDFGNKVFVLGPSYDPGVLGGLNQQEIAAKLNKPSDPVTQSIVGTANYLTASICAVTGNQPASVCSAAGTKKAAASMKLS